MAVGVTWRRFVSTTSAIAALLCGCAPGYSQSTASPWVSAVSIPFVGCSSSGQLQELEAPKGNSRLVAIGAQDAKALAYYKSADGITVLAPRGGYCQGVSGRAAPFFS